MNKLVIAAILLLSNWSSFVISGTTEDEELRMRKLAMKAYFKSDGLDVFWLDAKTLKASQCNLDFMNQVKSHVDKSRNDTEMIELYELLEKHIIEFCQAEFLYECGAIHDVCSPESDCGELTKGYLKVLAPDSHWHRRLPVTVAQILHRGRGPGIESVDEFRQVLVEQNPCRGLFEKIADEEMQDYMLLVEMVADSEYHSRFQQLHQQAADKVFACKELSTTDGLLQKAFQAYKIIV